MIKLSYLALGDSYTVGESIPEQESWPNQLCQQIRLRDLDLPEPQIIAKTGWSCAELDAAIAERTAQGEVAPHYSLVSLSVGVNNQYRGGSVADFAAEFRPLLDRAIALSTATHRTFVLSIPDWGGTPFAADHDKDPNEVATQIDQFNSIKRQICHDAGVTFFDVTQLSRDLPQLLAHDQLHPAGAQYAWWVTQILEGVLALLRRVGNGSE